MSASLLSLLHRANQIATETFVATLSDSTLTARQVQVLAAIDATTGPSQTTLVKMTGVDRATLADIVRRLQKHKLIDRRRSKTDGRSYVVRLTESGRQALAAGRPALAAVERSLLARLSAKERADFLATLSKVVEVHEARDRA